ncbi:hypothetical protein M8542_42460 [Amycolatopsis sp. OK19-0408]|uniref:Uncharacterized protein n=1 Tax=Amycolatopsis iheyensis TaxID=2945988 RepID=A0A9X2NL26_9PSEU|nr:hypothetical protein [Amycolatopsis iheyensis]MCR6489501.1 hypothetical protein [Amycolatopsis iheyensis]
MGERTRRATAVGATAFVLAGSAVLGLPGNASAAETKTVPCGSTVDAKPGDTVKGTTPLLGIPLNLGVVTEGTKVLTGTINALLGTLCNVTVHVVDAVVAPVPVIGAPAASAVNQGVEGLTSGAQQGLSAVTGGGKQQSPGTGGNQQQPPAQGGTGGAPQGGTPAGGTGIPEANSPLLPGFSGSPAFGGFPFTLGTGYAPMRDYSGIPFATAGLFTPSPAIRYGSQIPGYAPQYGLNGPDGTASSGNAGIQTAGQAEALPSASGGFTNGSNLPLLIAVLALSGVSAGLVRTWVLRRMAAAN